MTDVSGQLPLVIVESEYSFRQGECFDTYEQFLEKLERHSANDLVYYWRRDSRTIEGAALKTARPIADALRYYSVRYSCIFGGQRFETKSTGMKKMRSSLRNDCPAYIALRASKCGQQLVVMAASNVHNHEISQELIKNLAHKKKLSAEMKEEVMTLLFHNIDKKLIKEYVYLKEGKDLTTKDLFNIAASLRKSSRIQQLLTNTKTGSELTAELKKYIQEKKIDQLAIEQKAVEPELDSFGETETLEEHLEEEDINENLCEAGGSSSELIEEKPISTEIDGVKVEYLIDVQNDVSAEPIKTVLTVENRKRSRWKSASCFACGSNNRLVKAKLDVLRARRDKLRQQTEILRLEKQKLQLELQLMHKNLRHHKV
ncbi:uncharacterized protein LOC128733699 [Sabethes cyaneus]|uniref:uncharacterized protein LOC128733699 n=1 Tax=Sabethes cyaneus TaxID=53552 RepID=UPI00237DE0D5|nr:uncharacterized protein LOC128733699 [Sabethes cyaneus]